MTAAPGEELKGRTALVTGAGRGVGRATALRLRTMGADVIGAGRTRTSLEDLKSEAACEYVVVDLTSPGGCERLAEAVGHVDILINNAAVGSTGEGDLWDVDPAVWRDKLAINLDAPFHLTRLLARSMVDAGWGRIVMIASTAGLTAWPAAAYAASKHGLVGLMRSVALQVGAHGVTCNAVCPGSIRTEMAEQSAAWMAQARGISADDVWTERAALYPRRRVLEADEVAEIAAFLATPAASGINGEAVKVALGGHQ